MPPVQTGAPVRLDALTSLRFFAALAVVVFHIGRYVDSVMWVRVVDGIGYVGVTFFFVLSGFVLTWSQRPADTARRFYWRRFARIVPVYLAACAFALAMSWARGDFAADWPGWGPFVAVLLLVQAWSPHDGVHFAVNGPMWSLSCEMFFYAVFPFIVAWALGTHRRRLWAIAAVGFLAVGAGAVVLYPDGPVGVALYVAPYYRIGEFVLGMLLAGAMRSGWRPPISLRASLALVAAAWVACQVAIVARQGLHTDRVPYILTDLVLLIPVAALVAAAAQADLDGVRHVFGRPSLVKLGQWSFALYLVHFPIVATTAAVLDGAGTLVSVVVCLGALLAAVGLSGVVFELFERPVERALRSWAHERERPELTEDGLARS